MRLWLAAAVATISVVAGMGTIAIAEGSTVTRGTFASVPGHPDFGITGTARMVRTSSDQTLVYAHLEGLDPGQTYPAHVHNAPCESGGGGHYQNEVGGAAAPPNELWLTSTKTASGILANQSGKGSGKGKADWLARPEAQSIVVHHYADTSIRVACAQLS